MGHQGQLPPQLSQAIMEWAEASAELAAVLRQIDWDDDAPAPPCLRLVECRPRSHARPSAWRSWLDRFRGAIYRVSHWQHLVVQAVTVHPGFVAP